MKIILTILTVSIKKTLSKGASEINKYKKGAFSSEFNFSFTKNSKEICVKQDTYELQEG